MIEVFRIDQDDYHGLTPGCKQPGVGVPEFQEVALARSYGSSYRANASNGLRRISWSMVASSVPASARRGRNCSLR